MKRVFLIFKWTLTIMLLVIMLAFTNERQAKQFVSLSEIHIIDSEDDFVNRSIVLAYLKRKNISFDSLLFNDFKAAYIERMLKSHPAIKNVEVYTNQKGGVTVSIEQKKAIVRLKTNSDDYYLDEFGKRMELSDNYTPSLLVFTGNIERKMSKNIFDFINEINQSEFWKSQLTQIHFEGDNVILIPRVGEHKIHIGDLDNISEKLNNLYQFYNVALSVKGWQTYSDINLEYKDQIVCTKK